MEGIYLRAPPYTTALYVLICKCIGLSIEPHIYMPMSTHACTNTFFEWPHLVLVSFGVGEFIHTSMRALMHCKEKCWCDPRNTQVHCQLHSVAISAQNLRCSAQFRQGDP